MGLHTHTHTHTHTRTLHHIPYADPIQLGAAVLDALVDRAGIDAAHIDDVIVGCVSQTGGQAGNIGRNMVLASKIPESVRARPGIPVLEVVNTTLCGYIYMCIYVVI